MQRKHVRTVGVLWCWLLAAAAGAQPELLWGIQFGTKSAEWAECATPDGAGGAYLGGATEGSLGGQKAGGYDPWIVRYDGEGKRMWAAQHGSIDDEWAMDLAPDGSGGVYLAGWTWGLVGEQNFFGGDAWLSRYEGQGQRLWVRQIGTDGWDDAQALAPDGAGGVYIAGETTKNLGGDNQGVTDAWLARYDSAGNRAWIAQLGTGAADKATALAPDGAGGVFAAGNTSGTLGEQNFGSGDIWVARYDGAGKRLWVAQLGSNDQDEAWAAAEDGADGVYILGHTYGDLGGPNQGDRDVVLARYDGAGARQWAVQFGTDAWDLGYALAPDGAGGVLVTGETSGALAGPNAGHNDLFVGRFGADGKQAWMVQDGTVSDDQGHGLAPDGAGGFLLAGFSGAGLYGQQIGNGDVILARFGGACYPDFTGDGVLDLFDFLGYVNAFNAGDAAADCDGNGPLDLFDFLCFVNEFNVGC